MVRGCAQPVPSGVAGGGEVRIENWVEIWVDGEGCGWQGRSGRQGAVLVLMHLSNSESGQETANPSVKLV